MTPRPLILAGLVVAACEYGAAGLGSQGGIDIVVAPAASGTDAAPTLPSSSGEPTPMFQITGHLTGVTVIVSGPTAKTQQLTASGDNFTGTVEGLEPGTYSVAVVGLVGTEVDHVGSTTGVQVRAGQNETATISNWSTVVPTLDDIASPTTALRFLVSWNQIAAATGYVLEWSRSSSFSSLQSMSVTDNTAAITLSDIGTVYVRVRSEISELSNLRASEPKSADIVTDITPSGDDAASAPYLGFGDAINRTLSQLNIFPAGDADVWAFDACQKDVLNVDVRAQRLDPPSQLNAVLVLYRAADGTAIYFADDSVGVDPQFNRAELPADDTYYLVVAGAQNTEIGAYEVDLALLPGADNTGTTCN
jgi:hypothetical protein